MVSNDEANFFWYEYDDDTRLLNLNSDIDLSGFTYWATTTSLFQSIKLLLPEGATERNPSQTIPTSEQGYNFWILSDRTQNNPPYGRAITWEHGGEWYYHLCSPVNTIVLADKTLRLVECDGIPENMMPFHTIIVNLSSYTPYEIYFLIYTDEDLSYITDSTSLYNFLDNQANYNSIYGGSLPEQGITLPAGTCDDLGTFAGAMCQVLTYLFIPSTNSLTNFTNLKDEITAKPPLGYFYSIKDALSGFSATSTPAFVYPDVGVLETGVFSLLRSALLIVMWIVFGVWIIRRVGNFDF